MPNRKIQFKLEPDEDGYPPFGAEHVWASETEQENVYVITNIPVFATLATIGDRVRVDSTPDGLVVGELLESGGHSLIRVIFHDKTLIPELADQLKQFGCRVEGFLGLPILAVDVPNSVAVLPIQRHLGSLEATGRIGYEEPLLRHDDAFVA